MHLHVSRVRRKGKTYAYAQLVHSFRRADGMPTQKVIANLGRLSANEIDNLRVALKASRQGQRVLLDSNDLPSSTRFFKPTENLRYLDVAVLVELWRRWGLDRLLADVLGPTEAEVAGADVVAALAIQRCVDPGSKLYAERWFPTTALPELLGINPKRFNNTRLHRVLDRLDAVTPALMGRLPALFHEQQGSFATLFVDVTDTRFVGRGPELAEKGKTKEGIFERKVGIVLLCNERGYPLRWEVVSGNAADNKTMHAVFDDVRGLAWTQDVPMVCDRAMGNSADIAKLLRTGVHFVTALKSTEFGSYTDAIAYQPLADLEPSPALPDDKLCTQAAGAVEQAGMKRVSDTMYVLDAGVVTRSAFCEQSVSVSESDPIGHAMRLARQTQAMVERGTAASYADAIRQLGLSSGKGKKYRRMLKLERGIQQQILDGRAATLSVAKLVELGRINDAHKQRQRFERLLASATAQRVRPAPSAQGGAEPEAGHGPRVRVVVAFNPVVFVNKRRSAQRQLQEVQLHVRELNRKLVRPGGKRQPKHIEAELERLLRRNSLLDVYRIVVDATASEVRVELDEQAWQRRRRYDGFSLIVAHPELERSAAELCQLYRAKDAVEKDFQLIKGLIKLRPVWHRTDAKVRAHVTLCMLALLLERTLDDKLPDITAQHALELLRPCCLNRFEDHDRASHYVVTQPRAEQATLLRRLDLKQLTDDDHTAAALRPR